MRSQGRLPLDPRKSAAIGPRNLKDPKSVDFAWQTIGLLKTTWESKRLVDGHWERVLAEVEANQIYTRVPPDKPYGSLDAMLKAEIGFDKAESIAEAKRRVALTMSEATPSAGPKAGPGRGHKTEKVLPGKLFQSDGGNRAEYLASRIKAKAAKGDEAAADIVAKVERGEYSSMRAAARDAGILKPSDPFKVTLRAALRLPRPDLLRLVDELVRHVESGT